MKSLRIFGVSFLFLVFSLEVALGGLDLEGFLWLPRGKY